MATAARSTASAVAARLRVLDAAAENHQANPISDISELLRELDAVTDDSEYGEVAGLLEWAEEHSTWLGYETADDEICELTAAFHNAQVIL